MSLDLLGPRRPSKKPCSVHSKFPDIISKNFHGPRTSMAAPQKPTEGKPTEESSTFSCGSWDRNDPHQQEVSRILKDFKMDLMGVISIGTDGVLRSLTAYRTVIDAQGLSKILFCNVSTHRSLIV